MGNKKTKDIINICKKLINQFNSKVPNSMEQLLQLPGVGRKTANLVLATIYSKPTIVVDTHVLRISNRLGLVNSSNAKKVEFELLKLTPKNETNALCHRIIMFGRNICIARKPKCEICPFKNICINAKNKIN